ncbi:MAG: alpha,alpha-trehalase [Clostridia bacterium]|nr:alpha,alpha-trehalase [Clostridia bacterium]
MNKVLQHIEANWENSIREAREDHNGNIGLPYPFSIPAAGHFDNIYYWDTYFTNIGLLLDGRAYQAKNNVDDMLYLVDRYGYMLNANREDFVGGSQPPFLCEMVRDVYDYYKDKVWLLGAYETLKKEHNFWMTERNTGIGLCHYGRSDQRVFSEMAAREYQERVGLKLDMTEKEIDRLYAAVGESGWDASPRWGNDVYSYASVDLNSLLYLFETNMAFFARELKKEDEAVSWDKLAEDRKEKMYRYLDSGEALLEDFNPENGAFSKVLSAAIFYPLFAGLATKETAEKAVSLLPRLETPYGILTCEKNDTPGNYQWDYPNGWACLQYVVLKGLYRYGYTEEAKRIAGNYVRLVEKVYDETGNLWEKYNVVEGNINVSNEYKMPAMMGWTAGVYLGAQHFLETLS